MEHIKNLSEERRRSLQQGVGLTVVKTKQERNRRMDTNQTPAATNRATPSRAQQTLEHLASRLDAPPTFKDVALHELKRAAVWVPIIVSCAVSVAWGQRRYFLKAMAGDVSLP